jgi:hypothetical protein
MFQAFHLDVAYVAMSIHACFKRMFQTFHYVISVSFGYCKSRSGCCICCYGYTCMFQEHVLGVSSVFRSILHVFDLDVANGYVASVCSKFFTCFRRMLQLFYLRVAKVDHRCGGSLSSQWSSCYGSLVWRRWRPRTRERRGWDTMADRLGCGVG